MAQVQNLFPSGTDGLNEYFKHVATVVGDLYGEKIK